MADLNKIIDELSKLTVVEAAELSKQLEEKDHYFHFLQSILKDFHKLDKDQQNILKQVMNIHPQIITKEKIIYKEKKVQQKKPKLNVTDDY